MKTYPENALLYETLFLLLILFDPLFLLRSLFDVLADRKDESHSMTQESRHNCVAILTPFLGGVFSSPFGLPTPSAPRAWSTSSSNCTCRASMACHHFVSITVHHCRRVATGALMDLLSRLFLGAPVTTWGSAHTKVHKGLNNGVSSRLSVWRRVPLHHPPTLFLGHH